MMLLLQGKVVFKSNTRILKINFSEDKAETTNISQIFFPSQTELMEKLLKF